MGSGTQLRVVRESIAVGIVVFWLSCRLGCGSGDDKVVVVEVVSVVVTMEFVGKEVDAD